MIPVPFNHPARPHLEAALQYLREAARLLQTDRRSKDTELAFSADDAVHIVSTITGPVMSAETRLITH